MNNASVQQQTTAASRRPLLPLPPAAKVLGLNGEVPSQGPEGPVPRLWAGGVSPAALRSPGERYGGPFLRQSAGLPSKGIHFPDRPLPPAGGRVSAALNEWGTLPAGGLASGGVLLVTGTLQ